MVQKNVNIVNVIETYYFCIQLLEFKMKQITYPYNSVDYLVMMPLTINSPLKFKKTKRENGSMLENN